MAAITVLNQANVPTGPYTREQVAEKLRTGEMTLTDLAFVEGLAQWTPLREVLAKVDGSVPASSPVTLVAPPPAAAAYSYAATMGPPNHIVYGGFWLRFVALFIDGLIVGIPVTIVSAVVGGIVGFSYGATHPGHPFKIMDSDGTLNSTFVVMELGIVTFSLTVRWLYFALQESSAAQATVGKRVMGLKVTNVQGNRIGFGQATGRFFAKLLSGAILCIGYIMAAFTDRKQALHDMLADTLVVRQ